VSLFDAYWNSAVPSTNARSSAGAVRFSGAHIGQTTTTTTTTRRSNMVSMASTAQPRDFAADATCDLAASAAAAAASLLPSGVANGPLQMRELKALAGDARGHIGAADRSAMRALLAQKRLAERRAAAKAGGGGQGRKHHGGAAATRGKKRKSPAV
jgi:hypothetical protein